MFSHTRRKRAFSREYFVVSRYDITVSERENPASITTLLRVIPSELRPEWDGDVVRVAHDGWESALRPEWVGEGLPADARRAVNALTQRVGVTSRDTPVVTARRVSPGAREVLEANQLSWADATGRARIVVPGRIYIARLEPIRADAGRTFKWSSAADAIAETLLSRRAKHAGPGATPLEKVAVVAEAADVSLAHTARVLRQFDEQGYTAKTGAERGSSATREFRDPGRMLSDWAGHYAAASDSGGDLEFHVPWREPQQSISVVADALAGHEWALTGEAAADRIAPFLTSVPTVDLYVPQGQLFSARDRLLQNADVVSVESGGRIRVRAADAFVFPLAQEVRGAPAVSSVRVYADLLRNRGRSAEAGDYLREVAIGF